jgi:hypothetical protein
LNIAITKMILAAVVTEGKAVSGLPVFYAKDEQEQATMATVLSRVLEAVAHDMGNGVFIIVKH